MQLQFCPIFSGSSGNALYVGCGETRLLVDAGVSGKRVAAELQEIGVSPAQLTGLLVTHEHGDHIAGVGILSRRYDLPIYATERAWRSMRPSIGEVAARNVRMFEPEHNFYIGSMDVMPFRIPHDAADPVGFSFYAGQLKLSIATDIGCVQKSWMDAVAESDILLLESNHDVGMLEAGPYPYELKRRILSSHGHLSNEDASSAAVALIARGVRNVILGHLSGENNHPELAYETAAAAFRAAGIAPGEDIGLSVALRHKRSALFTVEARAPMQRALNWR